MPTRPTVVMHIIMESVTRGTKSARIERLTHTPVTQATT